MVIISLLVVAVVIVVVVNVGYVVLCYVTLASIGININRTNESMKLSLANVHLTVSIPRMYEIAGGKKRIHESHYFWILIRLTGTHVKKNNTTELNF